MEEILRPDEDELMAQEEKCRKSLKTLGKAIAMRVFVTVLLFFVLKHITLTGWIGWIVKAAVSVAISGVICLIVYRRTKGFAWLVYKAKSIVGLEE